MAVVYIVTVFLVTALLLSIPLFPFWKVSERLKTHHPDIWNSKGPFGILSLLAAPALLGSFFEVLEQVEKDAAMKKNDPELVKWCVMAREVLRMLPRSFPAQIGYFIIFLYFTGFFTSVILTPFKH